MSRVLLVEADGGSRGNPGIAGSGTVVIDPATGEQLAAFGRWLGIATNNVAEYQGMLDGVRWALAHDAQASILVKMDSKLVVEQMSGRWKIKHADMQRLAGEARRAIGSRDVRFEWVPRASNSRADAVANRVMDARADVGVDQLPAQDEPGGTLF